MCQSPQMTEGDDDPRATTWCSRCHARFRFKDGESGFTKVFGISRIERANMRRLGISRGNASLDLDSNVNRLMNSVTPVPDSSAESDAEIPDSNTMLPQVRWSIFDLFENDLVPCAPEPWIIRACSLFAEVSSTLMFVIGLWSVWYSSLIIAFWEVLEHDHFWGIDRWRFAILWSFDILFDLIFMVLVLARPFTSVIEPLQGHEVCNPRRIMLLEMSSFGFWIDLISSVPWTSIAVAGFGPIWVGVFKMLRVQHLASQPSVSIVFQKDARLIVRLISLVMLGGHCISCVYFAISWHSKMFKRHPYFQLGHPYGFVEYYTYALRASVYLVVGTDVEGYSEMENTFIFFITPLGVMVNALVFSQIIVVISRRSTLETQEVEEDNNTRQAMQTLSIPSSLQLRIFAHYTYERVHRGHGTVDMLLGGLSDQLNFELHLARHYRLVTAVPFFRSSHPYVLREIVLVLTDVIFLPGDWICRLGEEGKEMYFLHKGACAVLTEDMLTMLRQVTEGDYFGEISLLTGMQRTAYVRADTFCMVAELAKDKFDQIMRRFPQQLSVIVSGFSEEQKTLLLQIRQRLHQPNELPVPLTYVRNSARNSLQNLQTPGGLAIRRTIEDPGASPIHRTPAEPSAPQTTTTTPPAPSNAPGVLLVPQPEPSQPVTNSRRSSLASPSAKGSFRPVGSSQESPFRPRLSKESKGSKESSSMAPVFSNGSRMIPVASIGSTMVGGAKSLLRSMSQHFGSNRAPTAIQVIRTSEGSHGSEGRDSQTNEQGKQWGGSDGSSDNNTDEDGLMGSASQTPSQTPAASAYQSSRRPSFLESLASIPTHLFQRRQSVPVGPSPSNTSSRRPSITAQGYGGGLERRKTLKDLGGLMMADPRLSTTDEADEEHDEGMAGQDSDEVRANSVQRGADEISESADGLVEADRELTGASSKAQEVHQSVYSICQTLEMTWLTKRAEIRDERTDMAHCLHVLAEQTAHATSQLMRIVMDDTRDDVALKAIDIVERNLEPQNVVSAS